MAPVPVKNPVAVELGRRGGLKGGRARAEQLTPERRRAIALKAAQARWGAKGPVAPDSGGGAELQPVPVELAAPDMPEPVRNESQRLVPGDTGHRPAGVLRAQASTGRREPSLAEWGGTHELPGPDGPTQLGLADWRRRMSDLYSEVRRLAQADPEEAWRLWRAVRVLLYRRHPLSPVPAERRAGLATRHFPYDAQLRFEVPVRPDTFGRGQTVGGPSNSVVLPNSGQEMLTFERVGRVELPIGAETCRLSLFWISGYAGGLFLPFRDATNGIETYVAGRYLLDTAKGADLGSGAASGTIVVDFNFAFQPSCALDPRWSCPLAPPENRLEMPIRAGERLA